MFRCRLRKVKPFPPAKPFIFSTLAERMLGERSRVHSFKVETVEDLVAGVCPAFLILQWGY